MCTYSTGPSELLEALEARREFEGSKFRLFRRFERFSSEEFVQGDRIVRRDIRKQWVLAPKRLLNEKLDKVLEMDDRFNRCFTVGGRVVEINRGLIVDVVRIEQMDLVLMFL